MEKSTTGKEKKARGGMGNVLSNLKTEFSRIIWPNKDSLTKSTVSVLISSVALGIIIAVIDMIIKFGLGFVIA